ncbi:hypothetical protein T4A_11069 [Trichinella pseudospiralis]|uniref:Uncharacterized protein n=1 Tax=Trichinella pseudospiralis TaxID=6337 RepID=A0A0V1EPR4_TRIPS|nr:hypothetical protein T4A_11069 [Trichinella pseudospiralis]
MNRNTHEEERRKVAEALSIARMDRLDRIVRWSVAFVGQIVALWRRYNLPKSSVKGSSLQRHNE